MAPTTEPMFPPRSWFRPSIALQYLERVRAEPDSFGRHYVETTAAMVAVLDQVDRRLLAESLSPEEGLQWFATLERLHAILGAWKGGVRATLGEEFTVLEQLLRKCPDQPAPAELARLRFIDDPKLQEVIGRDIDTIHRLMVAEEWKAATVIGGSVVEAILLDRLESDGNEPKAVKHGAEQGWKKPLPQWDLWQLVRAAQQLGLIEENVAGVGSGRVSGT